MMRLWVLRLGIIRALWEECLVLDILSLRLMLYRRRMIKKGIRDTMIACLLYKGRERFKPTRRSTSLSVKNMLRAWSTQTSILFTLFSQAGLVQQSLIVAQLIQRLMGNGPQSRCQPNQCISFMFSFCWITAAFDPTVRSQLTARTPLWCFEHWQIGRASWCYQPCHLFHCLESLQRVLNSSHPVC